MTSKTYQDLSSELSEIRDALLNIKRLAEKSGDDETDPFALLDLIADYARNALQPAI